MVHRFTRGLLGLMVMACLVLAVLALLAPVSSAAVTASPPGFALQLAPASAHPADQATVAQPAELQTECASVLYLNRDLAAGASRQRKPTPAKLDLAALTGGGLRAQLGALGDESKINLLRGLPRRE